MLFSKEVTKNLVAECVGAARLVGYNECILN